MDRFNIKKKLLFNKSPHFIGSWKLNNNHLCNQIINYFETNEGLQQAGSTLSGKVLEAKKTTDITIRPSNLVNPELVYFNNYMKELHNCFIDYTKQWSFLRNFKVKQIDIPSFNIQRYSPGDHFAGIHTERWGFQTLHRVFAWMTYLNDVNDGGETEFTHYGIKIKPEIGKTLIWPAEWTHAHRGNVVKSGKKYIITGWMNFSQDI
tara:strand:+ start:1038 stop:1655 length:618 start_codon:yes stop_codon:yes gene_type:complete